MCRSIKTLVNFEPPATESEVHAAALQFVRKISGMQTPSAANEAVFTQAVAEVTSSARRLLAGITIVSPPKNREREAEKARARSARRFGTTAR